MQPDSGEKAQADRRNLATLFTVSMLIGLGVAVYDTALPLYLKEVGLDWRAMGAIYGVAAVATVLMRVGVGAWSDRVGRKVVYVGSLVATSLATFLTPLFGGAVMQGTLKSVTDPTTRVREAIHSVLLYESWPRTFQRLFSKTRGVEYLCHFLGLLMSAALLGWMVRAGVQGPQRWFLAGAATLLLLSGLIFAAFFRERPREEAPREALTWRHMVRLRLTRPMWVLTVSNFIFTLGITISHSFALQLFFKEKYGAGDAAIFTLGALHRLSSGLTLLFLGHLFQRKLRNWWMLLLVSEGVFIAAPSFMPPGTYHIGALALPALWVSVGVWLAHDFMGMGLWLPIQQVLMQRHSRPESRAEEIIVSTALGALGAVPAPFIAGWLRDAAWLESGTALNMPFLASGIGVALSALVLLWLPKERDAEHAT